MDTKDNYSKHAEFWDCFFPDRVEEIEFWSQLASHYGKKVFAPMAATGEIAAGLAQKGFKVIAVDGCNEMVKQGQHRAQNIETLTFLKADLISLALKEQSFDFVFFGTLDFHHFKEHSDQLTVLKNIYKHMKPKGGLALVLSPRLNRSSKPHVDSKTEPQRKRFEPIRPPTDKNIKIWKEGGTRFDTQKNLLSISQKLFVQRPEGISEYPYELRLRLFTREEIVKLLTETGFRIVEEYGTYKFDAWNPESSKWIILAEKGTQKRI